MLNEKRISDYFWTKVVAIVVYIMSNTPTTILHGMTPEEKYTSKKPDISHLKGFGCIASVHVLDERRTKLDQRPKNAFSLGILYNKKGIIVITLPLVGCK